MAERDVTGCAPSTGLPGGITSEGICVADLDIAPDGTVWVTEAAGAGYGLNKPADEIFRIDPDAAGAGSTAGRSIGLRARSRGGLRDGSQGRPEGGFIVVDPKEASMSP